MYFPLNFDRTRSIELADLVTQAYGQLEAFQKGVPWNLKGGYALVRQLVQETGLARDRTQYGTDLRLLKGAAPAMNRSYPIGFIARKGAEIFVAFRGTKAVSEWIRNLNVRLSSYVLRGFGKVHDGFLETYVTVRKDLLGALGELDPRSRLFVTGHSLGAALATLALPDIAASTSFAGPTLYTYGSPRVGDNQFCTAFDRKFGAESFRVVNTSDLVVSLPLPAPVFGVIGGYFTHVETPVDFTVQADDLEKNHSMQTYRSALDSAQKSPWSLRSVFKRREK